MLVEKRQELFKLSEIRVGELRGNVELFVSIEIVVGCILVRPPTHTHSRVRWVGRG